MSASQVFSVLALLAAMSGCEREGGGGQRSTAFAAIYAGFPGVVGLANFDGDVQEPPPYRVSEQPRLQIGSNDDVKSALHVVTDAARLRDGRVVVANAGTFELKFFDSRGGFIASTGQYGDGPGDFKSLSRIGALEDGRVAAVDMLAGRVSVFSADGVHERTYRVSPGLGGAWRRIDMFGFLANGTLVGLEVVADAAEEAHYGDYPASALVYKAPVVQPVLIDTAGQSVPFARTMRGDETLSQMQMASGGTAMRVGGVGRVLMPFLNSAAVAVRGDVIAVGHTSGFPIVVYDAQGKTGALFSPYMASAEVPEGAREAWVDEWIADRGERRIWRPRYEEFMSATPASLPAFKSLIVQEGRNVWVELFDPSADETAPSHWRVSTPLSPKDDPEGSVVLPPGFRPYDIGSDYVLGKWRDELGIEYVRLYDLIEVRSDGS